MKKIIKTVAFTAFATIIAANIYVIKSGEQIVVRI